MSIEKKSLDHPDATEEYPHGDAEAVQVGDAVVWRSRLRPGWSWATDASPKMGGAQYCPADHYEYVVAGKILYRMSDGSELQGEPGDFLVIGPGHAGEVVGDEVCVLIDW